ncbi:general substrate transporter [Diplogelasinospora grovesii]|uniref:General substrate transporter n=1 Tax=Diplogelasinospora grovesii TaxID=303347 RepID=A0AAN6N083_9PEZI|nr:general substrate transporter [Diplogelasinospora grovesii]
MAVSSLSLTGPWLVGAITSACSSGFLLFGYDQGVMSGVVLSPSWLAAMDHPSELVIGTITALYDAGAVVGALLAALTGDRLGRKRTLLLGALLVVVGGCWMSLAFGRTDFMIARVLVGIGIGYTTSVTPVYQSEISGSGERGWQVCCQLTTMLGGLLLAYCVNYGFYDAGRSGGLGAGGEWRLPLGLQCVFAVYILVLTPFLPDTPRWYLKNDETTDRGVEVLARLRGRDKEDDEVQKEVDEILSAIEESKREEEQTDWRGLLRADDNKRSDKRFYLAVGIQFMQQMSGINIVTYYAPTLYTSTLRMSQQDALLLGCFTQLWYVLASFVTWYTIDRVGRRRLLVSMALGMCLVLVGEAVSIAVAGRSKIGAVAAVIFVFLFEACFTWGWMACVWIYPPEILPLKIRAKGSALAAAADFVGNFIVVEVTPWGIARMGWKFYIIWAVFNLVNAVVVWLFYPETGGLTLEAVDRVFNEEMEDNGEAQGFERLQWAPVRVAAQAVKKVRRRNVWRNDEMGADESERGLLDTDELE